MYKTDLVDKMFEKSEARRKPIYATRAAANEALEEMLGIIMETVSSGETVQLTGFGSFTAKPTAERQGTNPSTHEPMTIPAGLRVSFKAGTGFKNAVKS